MFVIRSKLLSERLCQKNLFIGYQIRTDREADEKQYRKIQNFGLENVFSLGRKGADFDHNKYQIGSKKCQIGSKNVGLVFRGLRAKYESKYVK